METKIGGSDGFMGNNRAICEVNSFPRQFALTRLRKGCEDTSGGCLADRRRPRNTRKDTKTDLPIPGSQIPVSYSPMERKTASQFDQELLDLYDDYAHSRIGRRDFLERASKFAAGGLTAAALLEILSPNYAWATQIAKDDPRLKTETAEYESPKGAGKMKGYLA